MEFDCNLQSIKKIPFSAIIVIRKMPKIYRFNNKQREEIVSYYIENALPAWCDNQAKIDSFR